ncbi:glycosyltransferase family 4 protein [Patescibacteria group bacterium]|nr:glycosyltransferase family 4 protein [Patescibacteria group bacterium]
MAQKILFIITKSEMGGAQRFLYEFVVRLSPLKYNLLVVAGGNGELLEKLEKKNIKTSLIKNFSNIPGFKNILAFFEILFLIKNFKPGILYLLSSEAGFSGALAGGLYRLLSRKKIKIIYRIGGWAFKEPRNIAIKKLYLLAEKISAPFKDIIITNSEFDRQLAIKNKIVKPEKITTIYNGLDVESLKFLPKEESKKRLGLKNNIVIGTIANLYKNKGLEYLIYAAAKIKNPELKFVIIGDGPEKENLKRLIGEMRLENSVFLTGYIDDAYRYLKAFDIFALPSVKEGQPWTILEAMAAEIPIVATNIAGIPEMLENEKSGFLVEPADPQALALSIEKMLTHTSLAKECAKNALVIVREKFNLVDMIRKNEELF